MEKDCTDCLFVSKCDKAEGVDLYIHGEELMEYDCGDFSYPIEWPVEGTFTSTSITTYSSVAVDIVYLDNYSGDPLEYAHDGDSGFDFRADTNYEIAPGQVKVVKTGVKMAIPTNFELQVRTRSGSPIKRGFVVANSPGTVDSGYRGEIGVLVHNIGDRYLDIAAGERIAQGVICPVFRAAFNMVTELDETSRGDGAYNSTGTK